MMPWLHCIFACGSLPQDQKVFEHMCSISIGKSFTHFEEDIEPLQHHDGVAWDNRIW